MEHVLGYVVANDVSARDWQGTKAALRPGERGDGQWLRAKGSDTFFPMGPVLVTADQVPDPHALRIRSWRVPGRGPDVGREVLMQDGTTADMIWRIPDLVEFVSAVITLEPGDVITSGSPAGVAAGMDVPRWLEPGDRIEATIQGIGTLVNIVADDR